MDPELARCYEILGLLPDATLSEARQAYLDLVRVWHPDRFQDGSRIQSVANDKLKAINSAFQTIRAASDSYRNQGAGAKTAERPDKDHLRPTRSATADPEENGKSVVLEYFGDFEQSNFPRWKDSGTFQEKTTTLLAKRCTAVSVFQELQDTKGQPLRGVLSVRERKVLLDMDQSSIFTPWLLMGSLYIRDILTLPGHQDLYVLCLKVLRAAGLQGEPLTGPSYFGIEREIAAKISSITVGRLLGIRERSGWSGFCNDFKASWNSKIRHQASLDEGILHISSRLFYDAAYLERPEFAKSFR